MRTETLTKIFEANFGDPTKPKTDFANKKTFTKQNFCEPKPWPKNHEPILKTWSNLTWNFAKTRNLILKIQTPIKDATWFWKLYKDFERRFLLTVCVSGFWAGWEKASEPKKLEARKMLLEAADSQKSAARFVRRRFCVEKTHSAQSSQLFYS